MWIHESLNGEGNGTPLQYSRLENPMDGGAWWATVHAVAKSRTRLIDFTFTFHFSLSCIGEGNGNALQYSCLENPRDGGAWWAAIYGVAQSRTRMKWLSSSSSSMKVWKLLSFVRLFATPYYTVHVILQARILELGSLSFLQRIFSTQRLNHGLQHYRQILYQLSHMEAQEHWSW